MGFFGNLFGRKEVISNDKPVATFASISTARTITHDATLVASLKRDHADLVALYQRIGQSQQAGKFNEIRAELINFKTRFEAHILTENVRFYTYLEQSLTANGDNVDLMRDFRREMNAIARGAVDFVKRYQSAAFDQVQREQFAQDYQAVGALLTQRIEREEASLYPLYQMG